MRSHESFSRYISRPTPREPEASEWGVSAADEEALGMFGFTTGGLTLYVSTNNLKQLDFFRTDPN